MSKTYKTDPWWVKAELWEPVHNERCVDYGPRRRWQSGADPGFVCDLPADPVIRNPKRPHWAWSMYVRTNMPPEGFTFCFWEPVSPSYYSDEGIKVYGREGGLNVDGNLYERGIRAQWRAARNRLLSTMGCYEYQPGCYCGLDEDAIPDPRHRHYALWDRW
jgi:hypothetical protein